MVTQGEHPSISLLHACNLHLDRCTVAPSRTITATLCSGQVSTIDEESGTADQKLIGDGSAAEYMYAAKLAAERVISDMLFNNDFVAERMKKATGIDVRAEDGKRQLAELDVSERTEQLAELPAKRECGSVVCNNCICIESGRSIHLDDDAEEISFCAIPIQPWFRGGILEPYEGYTCTRFAPMIRFEHRFVTNVG
eukprot:CAMPEP_0178476078 /NCGR_PEP_ID=MMETSP0696-20121128/3444_1 /TAXON_ID=265572 /ORGANISM="Extubocellulus spinifer, Strain CCMP396" /LENGTH=195 /DNA_ID=CAMNT_0020103375 /DNA_START=426 /DNA_END=1010 /DNA_ORIENTATION=+